MTDVIVSYCGGTTSIVTNHLTGDPEIRSIVCIAGCHPLCCVRASMAPQEVQSMWDSFEALKVCAEQRTSLASSSLGASLIPSKHKPKELDPNPRTESARETVA